MNERDEGRAARPRACPGDAAFRALAEAAGAAVFRTDGRGRLTEANDAFAAWSGLPAGGIAGRSLAGAGGPAEELRDDVARALAGARVEREGPGTAARATLVPFRGEEGEVSGVVGVVCPAGADGGRLERLRHTARGVAHDLNNLLAVVQAGASLLTAEGADGPGAAEVIASLGLAVDHAAGLTRRLADLCRPEPPAADAVDLAGVAAAVAALLRPTTRRRVRFDLGPPGDAPRVPGPREEVVRVLLNLCVNACDAMPAGGTLTVRADALPAAPGPAGGAAALARLRVADTGVGMPPEVRARVFEPGFSTKPGGGNTGIGLSVVEEVVRGRGGWVECRSAPGLGTTFDVYLPALAPAPPAGAPANPGSAVA